MNIKDFSAAIERAKQGLDYMIEDATSGEPDALQAMLENAEEVQRQLMRAITIATVAALQDRSK